MPVRSSRSVIVKPVPKKKVLRELESWVSETTAAVPEIRGIGYFGSYARGDYTPGSDLDLLVLVPDRSNPEHIRERLDTFSLPVPCELFVVREKQFRETEEPRNPFVEEVRDTICWIEREACGP